MKLLLTRPTHDPLTRYLTAWAQFVIDLAKIKNFDVFDLFGLRATKSEFESMIARHKPSLVMLNGHGNSGVVAGQDNEPLVSVGDNDSILADTVTYAVSCASASVLGPRVVTSGAVGYIGYTDDFFLEYDLRYVTRPIDDPVAALFLAPSNQVMISLLKGHASGEAVRAGRAAFRRSIRKVVSSSNISPSSSTASYLFWNYTNLRDCSGNA